jgi:hypothetical protein
LSAALKKFEEFEKFSLAEHSAFGGSVEEFGLWVLEFGPWNLKLGS